ncbi:MAG: hypothetical protein HFJ45_05400 [Clostridia bacterium]|nr:hypothetical protein [Clostridia bacterium]
MTEEKFGSMMYNGKMINLDTENVEMLEKISNELKLKSESIKKKAEAIFKQ